MPDGSLVARDRQRGAFPRPLAILALASVAALCALDGAAPSDARGEPIAALNATSSPTADYDGDGLTDAQEVVLGTFPYYADTDDDGYGDGEELARHSDPRDFYSVPDSTQISAGLTARGEDGALKLVLSVFEPHDQAFTSMARLGALRQGQVVSVPLARFLGMAEVFEAVGTDDSRIATVEIPIDPSFVHGSGPVTFFVAAGDGQTLVYTSAAKVDVTSSDGVLLLRRVAGAHSAVQASQGGGSIRQPIPSDAGGGVPTTWIPGAICFQLSSVVGGNGAVMLHQVIEADCLPGWDTYCASDCASTVGTTFETIDPAALLGG